MAAGAAPLVRCGERLARLVTSASSLRHHRAREPDDRRSPTSAADAAADRPPKPKAKPKKRKRAQAGSGRSPGRSGCERYRPGLLDVTLDAPAADLYGRPGLGAPARPDERADPHDPHPEQRRHERRARVRGAPRGVSRRGGAVRASTSRAPAGAASACRTARRPTGSRSRSRRSPSSIEVIRPGGLADPEGAPDPGRRCARSARSAATTRSSSSATCRRSRPATGSPASTGSARRPPRSLLLFCFGHAAHAGRPARRAGRAAGRADPAEGDRDDAHDLFLALLAARPRCTRPTST